MEIGLRVEDYRKTLTEASFDDANSASLIESEHTAYKLDAISRVVCRELRNGDTLAACDAYIEKQGIHYFMEFKNQKRDAISRKKQAGIRRKAFDSIMMTLAAFKQGMTLKQLCENAVFLVVYRDDEVGGFTEAQDRMGEIAREPETPLFGLDRIDGSLYAQVHTIPKSRFVRDWLPEIWG